MYDAIFYGVGGKLPRVAKEKLLSKHYLRRMPPVSHSFVAWKGDDVVGVITFGVPASRHLQMSACPSDPAMVLELNRLWIDDDMPRNTASFMIAQAISRLPPSIIVSYADTAAGHLGYVYRASNFFYAGWTDMDRKTPRFDYVPRNGKHSRDAFRSNDFDRVRREPKVKYWTVSGNRKERRDMQRLCPWPKLSWNEIPPAQVAA